MKEIPLTQGKVAMVDDDMYDYLMQWKWHAARNNGLLYARRRDPHSKPRDIVMHRVITGTPAGMVVDHINGNTLDNRRENLRICTSAENTRNRKVHRNNHSGFKGVCRKRRERKWCAQIRQGDRYLHIGYYETAEEAASAYDSKAVELYGEFARTNSKINQPPCEAERLEKVNKDG